MTHASLAVIAGLAGSCLAQECMWAPQVPTGAIFSPVPVYHMALSSLILVEGNGMIRLWTGSSWIVLGGPAFPGRYNASVCYDPVRQRVVLFDGNISGVPLGQTWEWNGSAWTLAATQGPVPRGSVRPMVYDHANTRCVLIDSAVFSTHFQVWQWDGVTWSAVPASGPQGRVGFGLAYDQQRQRVTVYGGVSAVSPFQALSDVWELNGASWSQRADGPPGRQVGAMGYDAGRGVLVMHGAIGSQAPFETWERDSATETWVLRATGGPEPSRRELAFPPAVSRGFAAVGTGVWEWNPLGSITPTLIGQHPARQDVPPGGRAEFSAVAVGSGPFAYQWRRNGAPISNGGGVLGVNSATLVIDPVATAHQGSYSVVVNNGCSPVTSNEAALFVLGPSCYPNCDGSTSSPILTSNDFICFLNRFAAQDPYANCDGVTHPPLFNANDFQCFLNKFAAGCL